MSKVLRRALPVVSVIAICVACGGERPNRGAAAGNMVQHLVDMGVCDVPWPKRMAALKQLRMMGARTPLDTEVVVPLLAYARYDDDPYYELATEEAARVLATGTESMDETVMSKMKSVPEEGLVLMRYVVALGLAKHQSPVVNKELVALASSREPGSLGRNCYALALAARGVDTKAWTEEVARAVSQLAEPEQAGYFLHALCSLAPKLRPTPALLDALWQASDQGSRLADAAPLALVAYASLAPKPIERSKMEYVTRRMAGEGEFWLSAPGFDNLLKARLCADPATEFTGALRLFGSPDWQDYGEQALASYYTAQLLMDEVLTQQVEKALSSQDPTVRLGAVRLASYMGPDASRMLPALERLRSDKDPRIAKLAGVARVLVGGLDEDGYWKIKDGRVDPRDLIR